MRRTKKAVASEEDLGGKLHEALGFRYEEVNEDVDGSLMVPLFGGYCFICLESVSKHLHQFLVLLFVNTTTYISYTLGRSLFESRVFDDISL